jgi:hypothetical protein
MKPMGWILMVTSWVIIVGIFSYCLTKVFTSERNTES